MRFSVSFMAVVFSVAATVSGQAGEFKTFFCKTIDEEIARSNNFCEAAKGATIGSPGFCCIRASDINKISAFSKGCADNGLVLGSNTTPCRP